MKKLNKLQINSEKIMKNEELMTLRGGYDFWNYSWDCWDGGAFWGCVSTILNQEEVALAFCRDYIGPTDEVTGPNQHNPLCDQY